MAYDRETSTYRFTPDRPREWQDGDFYLGTAEHDGRTYEAGYPLSRHALINASSRAGKGVGIIIPNLRRWRHNVLCIDPQGSNVEHSWKEREAMGQRVCVLDPLKVANVPDRLRMRMNPLDALDPNSFRIYHDIDVMTDGMVWRADDKAAHWDGGCQTIISGLIAHVISRAPPEFRNLGEVRRMMLLQDKKQEQLVAALLGNSGCSGLAQAGGVRISRAGGEGNHFLSAADENTKWLDSEPMREMLSGSDFKLSELKTGNIDVFLVVPFELLASTARFLRLFVRSAIYEMGRNKGGKCLFLLDEFYALGFMKEILVAMGGMPQNGVHLVPILQNLGQLTELYGEHGASTFAANSDIQMFFGMTDAPTPEHVSRMVGEITYDELGIEAPVLTKEAWYPVQQDPGPPPEVTPFNGAELEYRASRNGFQLPQLGGKVGIASAVANAAIANYQMVSQAQARAQLAVEQRRHMAVTENERLYFERRKSVVRMRYDKERAKLEDIEKTHRVAFENEQSSAAHAMKLIGTRRMAPDLIRKITRKGPDDIVARMAVAIVPGEVWAVKPTPYFLKDRETLPSSMPVPINPAVRERQYDFLRRAAALKEVSS